MSDLALNSEILKSQTKHTLAKNLVVARTARDLTQEGLAKKARECTGSTLSRATIADIEGGDGDPKLSTIIEIALALKVSPVMLMLDEQDLRELANVSKDLPKSDLSETQVEDMRRLLQSGISNKITTAVGIGVGAVAGLGLTTTGAMVGAAIGSVLAPGVATIVFAACLGKALSKRWGSIDIKNQEPSSTKQAVNKSS